MMNISMVANKNRHIFVDTWAWYALTDRNDVDHHVAETTNKQLLAEGHTFVTTNYVLSETVTHWFDISFIIPWLCSSGILCNS